jgi:hypothetical protein
MSVNTKLLQSVSTDASTHLSSRGVVKSDDDAPNPKGYSMMKTLTQKNVLLPGNDHVSNGPEKSAPVTFPSLGDARNLLELEGFAFVTGAQVQAAMGGADVATLVQAARLAPADPYDLTGSRFRRYHQATFFPWCSRIVSNPPFEDGPNLAPYSAYFQAKHFNIEYGNQRRRFAPFGDELLSNPALLALTNICFRLIPRWRLKGDGRWPVLVGMHLVRLQSDGRRAAVATPNHAHQDGEPFTFVIMLERDNIVGGVSYIVQARCAGRHPDDLLDCEVLATGTLTEPLDIAAVDDARVAHHVTGVLGADGRPGSRSVLLLDYSELHPTRTPGPQQHAND